MATTQELLDEAEAAYHRLMLGEQVVEVRDQSGESIRYLANSAARLAAYISQLKAKIATEAGCKPTGPMRFLT